MVQPTGLLSLALLRVAVLAILSTGLNDLVGYGSRDGSKGPQSGEGWRAGGVGFGFGYVHPDQFRQSYDVAEKIVFAPPSLSPVGQNSSLRLTFGLQDRAVWSKEAVECERSAEVPGGAEGSAVPGALPWEWSQPFANRSLLSPFLLAGLVWTLLGLARRPVWAGELMAVARGWQALLSLAIEWSVVEMGAHLGLDGAGVEGAGHWAGTSWALWALIAGTPFSNSLETILLALTLVLIGRSLPPVGEILAPPLRRSDRARSSVGFGSVFALGVLVTMGVFVRFTFVAFAVVPCLYFSLAHAWLNWAHHWPTAGPPPEQPNAHSSLNSHCLAIKSGLLWAVCFGVAFGAGVGVVGGGQVAVDSLFYQSLLLHYQWPEVGLEQEAWCARALDATWGPVGPGWGVWVQCVLTPLTSHHRLPFRITTTAEFPSVAPWNNLKYNAQPANLALHGLHPRYTHLLLNLPQLCGGPVLLCQLWQAGWALWRKRGEGGGKQRSRRTAETSTTPTTSTASPSPRPRSQAADLDRFWVPMVRWMVLGGAVVVSVAVLSVAPHQELRFLLPLLPLLAPLLGPSLFSPTSGRVVKVVWLVVNLVAVVFYGSLHQGGVVGSLLWLDRPARDLPPLPLASHPLNQSDTHFIYFHTYPPPTSLSFGARATPWPGGVTTTVHDLQGSPVPTLLALVRCLQARNARTFVVTPRSVIETQVFPALQSDAHPGGGIGALLVRSFWPHLSMECPPLSLHPSAFSLDLYEFRARGGQIVS